MKNIFALTKRDQRVVIVIVTLLLAASLAKYYVNIRSEPPPPPTSRPNLSLTATPPPRVEDEQTGRDENP